MLERLRNNKKEDQGFTLIELLVVMIIIGILAAIAIPIFLSQRAKAQDSASKADVSTLGKEIATWYVDNDNTAAYPEITINGSGQYVFDGIADAIGNASEGVVLQQGVQVGATGTTWCVSVSNESGDQTTDAAGGASYSATGGLQVGADAIC
jgi:prepilin-type N-terminal cleavage/methylation domain-containing protein